MGRTPHLVMYFAMVDGRGECVRIELGSEFLPGEDPTKLGAKFASGPLLALTTSALRSLKLHTEIRRARKAWVKDLELSAKGEEYGITPRMRREARSRLPVAREAAAHDRPGPRPVGKDHFEQVALVYRDAHARGEPPTQAVADHFKTSYSTAARWVGRTRNEFHLLPRTRRKRRRATHEGDEDGPFASKMQRSDLARERWHALATACVESKRICAPTEEVWCQPRYRGRKGTEIAHAVS